MSDSELKHSSEGGFYKGLFYGVVLGLGLVWFLGTKEGKEVKEELLTRGEDLLNQFTKDEPDNDEDETAFTPQLPPQ